MVERQTFRKKKYISLEPVQGSNLRPLESLYDEQSNALPSELTGKDENIGKKQQTTNNFKIKN